MNGGIQMKLTKKDVDNVAVLSRLSIPADQKTQYMQEIDNFLEYGEVLQQVDTEGIEPMAHVLPLRNVFRDDTVQPSLERQQALSNAPEQEDGYFVVPQIIE